MHKALFLDRDGVVNHLVLYKNGWDSPQKPQDVKLVKGIETVIAWANKNKILVVEVSNQPGVAKGKMSQKTSDEIEKRVHQLLKQNSASIDKVYICPHHPKGIIPSLTIDCDCRKPKTGLLFKAAEELKIDLKGSVLLGDKGSDVEAGKNVGCTTILYFHKEDSPEKVAQAYNSNPNVIVKDLGVALIEIQKLLR